ncbi:ATP-binding cassette sub-family C member Sur isoform X2 [Anopheles gambiae]|uniref:ATP-binding cassette sub-family C member Sur isoform X2 n=1 Tax=Anopheles gambiae TaxID=7165 RepID=UPI002AC8D647|nr:ATP-binding cassette sub-family C member Sur isoform X2 [Anopheles gambiae]
MVCKWVADGDEAGVSSPLMVAFLTMVGSRHDRLQPAAVIVVQSLYRTNVAYVVVSGLMLVCCLSALGYIVVKYEKRRHNLLALHNLRSIVLLVALLVGIGEIGHQWLAVDRLGRVRTDCTGTKRPEVHSTQSEAFTTDRAPFDGDAVVWKTVTVGLGAAWIALLALVGVACVVRAIERRDKCGLLYAVLAAEGAQSIVRWCKFKYINDVTDTASRPGSSAPGGSILGTPELFLTLAGALAATALTAIDGFTLYTEQNTGRRHVSSIMSSERKLGYKTPHSPFLSKVTFHWIVPLLWRGYREPLELEDLGNLHEKDTSRYHYDQFLFIYQSYKSTRASLWRCYVRNGWRMFLLGGLLKLAGDLCALVGPLCISNIVDYIAAQSLEATASGVPETRPAASLILANETAHWDASQNLSAAAGSFAKSNQSLAATASGTGNGVEMDGFDALTLTWASLFANGWIVCVLVLVASLAQGTLSQASTHLMDEEGIRLKNALQGLVYRKTLLLSTSCFHPVVEKLPTRTTGTARNQEHRPSRVGAAQPQQSKPQRRNSPGAEANERHRERTDENNVNRRAATATAAAAAATELDTEAIEHKTSVANSAQMGEEARDERRRPPNATNGDQVQQFNGRTAGERLSWEGDSVAERLICDAQEKTPQPAEEPASGNASSSSSSGGAAAAAVASTSERREKLPAPNFAHDAGTITNLMSDDAFNVMSFVKMVHYVWAIPLKIAVVMYLLYRQLGISTVIGSVVCIVTMTPLQLLIGKLMAANSKKVSECTDERLRRINEVLLGIKLIKLNAWETVFKDKISQARQQELRHLDLDSIYWTLMMLLTHISSVLITIVTIAVFLALENNPIELTAGRLFASLALFNQLTVPLFIFPITIPITLSAIVSTGRLEAFLGQPEVERSSLEGIRTMARILSKSDASLDMDEAGDPQYGDDAAAAQEQCPGVPVVAPPDQVEEGQQLQQPGIKSSDNVTGSPQTERKAADNAGPLPLVEDVGGKSCSQHSSMSSDRSIRCEQVDRAPMARQRPAKYQKTVPSPRVKLKKHSQLSVSARLEKCRQKQKHLAREMRFGLPDHAAVFLKDARFRWNDTGADDTMAHCALHIEQLTVPKAKLTVIVGRSGSGKSSLLAALLKEINHLSGELIWNKYSSIAYVPQKPWLQNATIRENVLFGESFRPKRYDRVLRACALKPDLDLMPAGDGTEIGERGLKLSGGQRQRIAIARALYSSANVVILDDPLSALDNEVAMDVFENGVHRMLARQKRTIILVTQKVQLVHRADNIVVMEGGTVSATGSLTEIENNYPHILREWNAIIAKEQQQSSEAQSSPGRTARERWKLFKNISRISFQRNHATEENDFMERTFYFPRTMANRALFGSRFSAHDFPLPIEDCHEPNVALRRHYSNRLRKDSPPSSTAVVLRRPPLGQIEHPPGTGHQSVFRALSLQLGTNATTSSSTVNQRQQRQPAVVVRHISFPTTLTSSGALDDDTLYRKRLNQGGTAAHPGQLASAGALSGQRRMLASTDDTGMDGIEPNRTGVLLYGQNEGRNSCEDLKRSSIGFRIPEFLRRMSLRGRRFSNPTEFGRPYREREDGSRKSSRKTSSLNIPKERHYSIKRLLSTISRQSEDTEESSVDYGEAEVSNRLIYDDERKYGRIPARMYWLYLISCGPRMVAIFFLSALAQQALKVYTDFWLQEWTDQTATISTIVVPTNGTVADASSPTKPLEIRRHFHAYVALSAVCIVLAAISVPAGQRAGSNARRRLHRELIASVLQNSIHFFQSVPLGRIMNRLSIDVAVVDKKIAATSQKLLQFILLCVCAVLINSVVTPYFILLTIPICGIYYMVQKFYRASSRELQRIESMTYSPVLAHFSETIEGVTTIRAFGQEARFMEVLFKRMEANNVAQLALNCSNRWLGIALDYLGAIIVFVAILTALITASLRPQSTSSSLIGLAVNYAMLVPIYLNWVVKLFAEMEMYGGAVERIQSFIECDVQRRRLDGGLRGRSSRVVQDTGVVPFSYKTVPISWPLRGVIVYEGVSLRYENQKENIITNLNLTIPAGQRLGICGRTGSGKSSLALALFGALEITAGRILIDDVDIAGLHTDELRSRLSIIPQEVMLFGGSVRENLDPRGHFSDLELWNCLELAQLKNVVMSLPDGLDTQISDDKHYFSSGQRQLFCLARAILRGSVCLVLDEATSSLDTETEKLVLQAAKKAFKGRTVITIAHRLHSLVDYERVLVLEQGRIVEDGCPRKLAGKPGSKFGTMLKATDHQQHAIVEDDEAKR